jgi:hypothetical protein
MKVDARVRKICKAHFSLLPRSSPPGCVTFWAAVMLMKTHVLSPNFCISIHKGHESSLRGLPLIGSSRVLTYYYFVNSGNIRLAHYHCMGVTDMVISPIDEALQMMILFFTSNFTHVHTKTCVLSPLHDAMFGPRDMTGYFRCTGATTINGAGCCDMACMNVRDSLDEAGGEEKRAMSAAPLKSFLRALVCPARKKT